MNRTYGEALKSWDEFADYSDWIKRFMSAIERHNEDKVKELIIEAFENNYDIPRNLIKEWVLDLIKHDLKFD